jgi:hypothetical protein
VKEPSRPTTALSVLTVLRMNLFMEFPFFASLLSEAKFMDLHQLIR